MNASEHLHTHSETATPGSTGVAGGENELITIVSEVEKQIQRIRQMQEAHERDLQTIEQRAAELDQAQAELTQRADELAERHAALTAERQAFDQQVATFEQERDTANHAQAERAQALESQSAELDERKQQLDDMQRTLRQQTKALKARETELDEQQSQIEAERASMAEQTEQMARDRKAFEKKVAKLEKESASLEQQLEKLRDEIDDKDAKIGERDATLDTRRCELEQAAEQRTLLEAQLAESRDDAQKLRGELDDVRRQLSLREEELSEMQRKFSRATEKLTELSGTLEEQAPLLERGAAAMVKVQHQQRDIERLTDELAQLRASADFAEVTRKDERLKELTDALRQARGQVAPDDEFARRDERITELHNQLEQARVEVQRARLEAEQATQRAAAAGDEEDSELASSLAQRDATIAQLSGEAKSLREQVSTLEQHVADSGSSNDEVESLRAQVQALQSELKDARHAAPEAGVDPKQQREVEEKAAMLREAAVHLRRRRDRLGRLRRALQARKSDGSPPSSGITVTEEQLHQLNEEAEMLESTRAALAASEQEMVRRWARTRSIVVAGWVAFLAALCAVASWVAADHFFPATVAANVELQAKVPPGRTIEPDKLTEWSNNHIALLEDERFHEALASRMAERRLDKFRSTEQVRQLIAENVHAEVSRPGAVMVTMHGAPAHDVLLALDTLAVTLATESSRRLARSASDPRPSVVGERMERGRMAYATLQSTPIKDDRVMYAGVVFGGGFVLCGLLVMLVYRRLLRSKRIFDAERPDVDFA